MIELPLRWWGLLALLPLLGSCDGLDRRFGAGVSLASKATVRERVIARYIGTLPCADCSGIRADLLLYAGGAGRDTLRYSLWRSRLDAHGGEVTEEVQGRWATLPSPVLGTGATVYRLEPDRVAAAITLLRIDDNRMRMLEGGAAPAAGSIPLLHRIEARREAGAVDLGPGDARHAVRVRLGQTVRVHLSSSPATGYVWMLEGEPTPTLRAEQDPGLGLSAMGTPRASAGLHTWGFRAQRPGTATLRFGYRRPWETSAAPMQTATFELLIR